MEKLKNAHRVKGVKKMMPELDLESPWKGQNHKDILDFSETRYAQNVFLILWWVLTFDDKLRD